MHLYIGTSGYSYPYWGNGVFYHKGLAQDQWLEFYSRQFNAVELNVTFYRLPDASMAKTWLKATPKEFRFVVKGSRFITHIKRLGGVEESLETLARNLEPLQMKMAAFLWQLPPGFKKDEQKLAAFCRLLQKVRHWKNIRHVFEFRDESWFCDDVYDILKSFQHCLCFADAPGRIGEDIATCDFIYLRFHGGVAFYNSNYSQKELEAWACKIEGLKKRVRTLYAFFNNDEQGFAVYNAQSFRMLLLEKKL